VLHEAVFFNEASDVADGAGVALDEDALVSGFDDSCRGERARAGGDDCERLVGGWEVLQDGTNFGKREGGPVGLNEGAVKSVGECGGLLRFDHACRVLCSELEIVMRGEADSGWGALMDEGVAEACAGVFPVSLVEDVVGVEVKGEMSRFAAGGVARAKVEEVVSGYADGVVARGLFAGGVAPAGHEVEAAPVRNEDVGEERGVESRHVDDLMVVVGRSAGIRGDGTDGGGGGTELHPRCCFALGVEFESIVGFVAGGFEAEVAWNDRAVFSKQIG